MPEIKRRPRATASKLSLRDEIADYRRIGGMMSNICFNLAQKPGYVLTGHDCEMMHALRERWDAIKRVERRGEGNKE